MNTNNSTAKNQATDSANGKLNSFYFIMRIVFSVGLFAFLIAHEYLLPNGALITSTLAKLPSGFFLISALWFALLALIWTGEKSEKNYLK